jgi:hypothetical protein
MWCTPEKAAKYRASVRKAFGIDAALPGMKQRRKQESGEGR